MWNETAFTLKTNDISTICGNGLPFELLPADLVPSIFSSSKFQDCSIIKGSVYSV